MVIRATKISKNAKIRALKGESFVIMGTSGGSEEQVLGGSELVSSGSGGIVSTSDRLVGGLSSTVAAAAAGALPHTTGSISSLFMATNTIQTQQRAVNDMLRHIQGMGNRGLSNFVGRPYGSGGSSMMGLHSNFGGDSAQPPPLDLSEFPSLSSRNSDSSATNPISAMAGRQPYVGMVKQPTPETSEFTMSSEDFPALPGSQAPPTGKNDAFSNAGDKKSSSTGGGAETPTELAFRGADKSQLQKRGIQTSPDGKVTNIPGGMVVDQFGMVGLLTFIRAAETDHNLVSLALGSDLTTLGLNLNSPENLYPNFAGPWAETPCRPQDIDYHVPQEYLTNQQIRGKLAPVKFDRYGEDLLFYMFYSNAGDLLQILAASELLEKLWRYSKYICTTPNMPPMSMAPVYMCFYEFTRNWRKVPKEFHLEYDKLEERPHIPSHSNLSHTPTSSTL
ncbi:unnamed protein product, partial [Meganyctiphanes norvegica]